jgi:hypothetical protein
MFRQMMAIVLCGALVSTGCASAGGPRYVAVPVAANSEQAALDRAVLSEYAQRIPAGSKVRVERLNGGALRGTLLKSGPNSLTVQLNTRIPEPPVDVPYDSITRLTLEGSGSSVAKNIAIGVASGVGSFFGIFLLLAAIYGD